MNPKPPHAVRIVSCPQCGTGVAWSDHSPYRPFCSERCKLIDLGSWAAEAYRVPVTESKERPEADDPGDRV